MYSAIKQFFTHFSSREVVHHPLADLVEGQEATRSKWKGISRRRAAPAEEEGGRLVQQGFHVLPGSTL